MNWFDKQYWRENIASTFLCFISCSIGMFLTALFFMTIFWLLQVFISILASYILSFIAIVLWSIIIRKINFSEAIKTSYHTSFVSIIIMMTISYLIMFLGMENHSAHGMQNSYSDNLLMMLIGMGVGFLVALPINYYILTKTGKACHTKTNLPGEQ